MSMSESFAELFEESLKSVDMKPGTIVTGVVIDLDKDWVTVHAGLKSEGIIPVNQYLNEQGELDIQIGDEVQVALESVEDGFGETRLSREKAKRAEELLATLQEGMAIQGIVKNLTDYGAFEIGRAHD